MTNAAAVDKAVFLLREAHQSPWTAQSSLKSYFPGMELNERVSHVRLAYEVIQGGRKVVRPRVSEMQDPRSFMVAHERHGFGE
ncbi:hypothetical protein ACQB60_01750 [Actinomycetota bacterium Odt1-20B]